MAGTWDQTMLGVIKVYSQRSHCRYFKVAAAFYRGPRLLTVGYNGPASGEAHCDEIGCAKDKGEECCGAHAEINAITNAASLGIDISLSTLCCAYFCCYRCAKQLINLPIKEFVYLYDYLDEDPQRVLAMFARHNIKVRQLQLKE